MALYIHCGFARVVIKKLIKENAEANGTIILAMTSFRSIMTSLENSQV